LELKPFLSAEPVNFGIAFGSCPDGEALADNHFRNYLLHRSGRQLSLPLDLRFAVLLAHNRFLFSSSSNGGKLSNPVSLRNSCFVGINNKPPSQRPSGFVIHLRRGLVFLPAALILNEGILYTASKQFYVHRQLECRLNFDAANLDKF
jgi:hypothetical protein